MTCDSDDGPPQVGSIVKPCPVASRRMGRGCRRMSPMTCADIPWNAQRGTTRSALHPRAHSEARLGREGDPAALPLVGDVRLVLCSGQQRVQLLCA